MLFAIGCGGGGSGSGNASAATAPIDLEPGQTTAMMAWEPSEGQVVGYLVFQSHDDDAFEFLATVATPEVQISGTAGDSIRILVVALGATSSESAASPPSQSIRFHAAEETAAALVVANVESPAYATAVSTQEVSVEPADSEASPSDASTADEDATDPQPADTQDQDATDNTSTDAAATDGTDSTEVADSDAELIDPALREQLLGANARFPFEGVSDEVEAWLQAFVDAQVGAGVTLAGSGELDGDALRELVWIDASGQLFISNGNDVATAEDLPSTFVEAIRLGTTERFAGLADFDGDGVGDWVIEDGATGDLWVLSHDGNDTLVEFIAEMNPDLAVVGFGDFDGDGRSEFLWQHSDSSFHIGLTTDDLASVDWVGSGDDAPANAESTHQLLTVADLNGDGLDDLVIRTTEGALALALSNGDAAASQFEWTAGPAATTDGLALVATLDLDQDGLAEIAWLADGELEIWNLRDAL